MKEDIEEQHKEYELSFLAVNEGEMARGIELVRRMGGEVFFESPLERIALAYKIENEVGAHFGFIHFKISKEQITALSKDMKTGKIFLRFLIITPPFVKPKQKSIPGRVRPRETFVPQGGDSKASPGSLPLSNEALEKKIEEILQE